MRSTGALLGIAMLLGTGLAGCFGSEGGDAQNVDEGAAAASEIINAIQGRVVSADFSTLELVKVEILSLNVSAQTNAAGEYKFINLEPRDYLITASKNGYKTLTQRAIVEDGKIFELDFTLDERPRIAPYDELQQKPGRISCKVVYGTDPESMSYRDCSVGTLDPLNVPSNEFEIGANAAQVVVEAEWLQSTAGSSKMTMKAESVGFGHQDVTFGQVTGPSGIRISLSQTIVEKFYPAGGTLRVSMDAGPSITGEEAGADAGAAISQDYTIYVTVFYVDPGPPSYTAMAPPE